MRKKREITLPVKIGSLEIGAGNEIVVQSMTNTDTNDVEQTVAQIKRVVEAGASMVRITVPSMKEVEAVRKIKTQLVRDGFQMPLIADVHFNPKVAEAMTSIVEKVRINPGNFVDKKNFKTLEMSEAEYLSSFEKMAQRAKPLFENAKKCGTVIRVGVNHGSLSDRIVNRYGNGPLAMAMSAMEWIEICRKYAFSNVVFSMKSSNVSVMTEATILLAQKMKEINTFYPLHLGVTEAGAGLDGRVKSAVGIGTLLMLGLGDTIRVSLTEKPENEIPFANALIKAVEEMTPDYYSINEAGFLNFTYPEADREVWIAKVAAACGYEHYYGKLKDVSVQNPCFSEHENRELALSVLQACRIKISKTEIISCPTCGRTQYNIEEVLERVRERFGHYPGLKIGVMGCIVNGPGEMADADYGIVGATGGNVAVYKGKVRLSEIIPEEEGLRLLEGLVEERVKAEGGKQ